MCVEYSSGTAAKLRGFSDRPLFQQFCVVVVREQSRDLLLSSLTRNPQTVTESSTVHYSLTLENSTESLGHFSKNTKGAKYNGELIDLLELFLLIKSLCKLYMLLYVG